ncbi:hypothetical protein DBV15_03798 [Temnothorax longispinosus]|uniref:Uncharacterized protein n=1 Tax=Temnothorax longispinosus TaxID=300112 RepID=A0A4V3S649_9HYME|nr:hypothetical protein DBV15_03798 [Temnothorax longispinosus]
MIMTIQQQILFENLISELTNGSVIVRVTRWQWSIKVPKPHATRISIMNNGTMSIYYRAYSLYLIRSPPRFP